MILVGDAATRLRELADESVHCCVTSPPYWGLRDYGVDGQIGMEETVEEFIDRLVEVFAEVRRVLRRDGTLWVNMGDCYTSNAWGGSPGAVNLEGSRRNLLEARKARSGPRLPAPFSAGPRLGHRSSWRRDRAPRMDTPHRGAARLAPKNLIGQPWRLAFALQEAGWILRSEIIWHKPSALPESVKDRPTLAHERVFLFAKSRRYYYDAASISEPCAAPQANTPDDRARAMSRRRATTPEGRQGPRLAVDDTGASRRRNKRTVWTIPAEPFKGAHFATYPRDLVRPCILAGCPRGGTVLDPFFGSGTTGVVATEEGRRWIGIELKAEYAEIAERRLDGIQTRIPMEERA